MSGFEHLYRLSLLAQLGLPERIFIPAFLSELHHHISSLSNSYGWLDRKLELTEFYDETDQDGATRTIKTFIDSHPPLRLKHLFDYSSIMTGESQWQSHALSRLYRQCFVAHGYHQSCVLPIIRNKTPHGFLILNWNRDQTDARYIDPKLLEILTTYFINGLGKSESEKTTRGWRTGQVITNQYGEVTHFCPEGKNLFSLALQKLPGNLTRTSHLDIRKVPGVMELISSLLDSPPHSVNAELNTFSHWGTFSIRGFPIRDDEYGQREPQIHLSINWEVPFSMLLFHNIKYMNFTPRQEVIGLLYAKGESNKAIANMLDLSLYTVKDHIQHIFENMQIHTRAELIENILCQAPGEHHGVTVRPIELD